MLRHTNRHFKFDWITIIIFLLLVGFGWLNILSASQTGEAIRYFDTAQPYGKQLIFIVLTFGLIIVLLALDTKFYERFSSVIYIVSMLSLVGLFIFGKNQKKMNIKQREKKTTEEKRHKKQQMNTNLER